MKKIFLILVGMQLQTYILTAQSVAINNDGSPSTDISAMLEIKKPIKAKLKLRSTNYADTSWLQLSNRNNTEQGTDFNIIAAAEAGIYFNTGSDLPENINDSLFTLLRTGRIGIGTKVPIAKLDVRGNVRIADGTQASGKIFTSDAAGNGSWQNVYNPLAFSATGTYPAVSNMISIPSGIETKVTIINKDEKDDFNLYDPVLCRASIPSEGWYHVDIGLQYTDAASGSYSMSLKNFFTPGGSNLERTIEYRVGSGITNHSVNLQISTDIYLPAGNYLEIYTTQYSGSGQDVLGGQFSWFNMHKIK